MRSPSHPRSRVGVVSGRITDAQVAARAGGEEVGGVVAHRLASGVVHMASAAGAAGELELAAIAVPFQYGTADPAPLAGTAGLPALTHRLPSAGVWA